MLRGLFARRAGASPPDASPPDTEPVKRLVRAVLAETAPDAESWQVTVSEIDCQDPACAGPETVILLMEPGRPTRAAKVTKGAAAVSEQDVRSALVAANLRAST